MGSVDAPSLHRGRQAEAIQRSNLETVPDPSDRADVTQRYEAVLTLITPAATVGA
jgi:hypothetical protein